jgi:hypothetical protein
MTREERAREALADHCGVPLPWMQGYIQVQQDDVLAAMLQFADAEAAAMRERAAGVADNHVAMGYMSGRERDYCHQHGDEIAELIRALPATGEVGRG